MPKRKDDEQSKQWMLLCPCKQRDCEGLVWPWTLRKHAKAQGIIGLTFPCPCKVCGGKHKSVRTISVHYYKEQKDVAARADTVTIYRLFTRSRSGTMITKVHALLRTGIRHHIIVAIFMRTHQCAHAAVFMHTPTHFSFDQVDRFHHSA